MTRLLTTGYETGDVAEAGVSVIGATATVTVVASVPTPRAGNYCLKLALISGNTLGVTYKGFGLPAAKTELWARFAFLTHAFNALEIGIAQLNDAGGAAQTSVTYNPADGLLRLYRGASNGTLLATSSGGFSPDTWHVLDWRTLISTATTGTSEVWLDGTRVINFSGDNSNTATLNVQTLLLGEPVSVIASAVVGTYMAYDDIAVNDTVGSLNNGRAGDGRVVLLVPNGAGTAGTSGSALARGGTDTGANYSQVNELPPSLTQYVYSATIADRDLYTIADLPVVVSSVNVVEAIALVQNSDAGTGSIGLTLKSGAVINEASAISLTNTAVYARSQWETDPNTSVAWTAAGVNSLEAGVTVR